MYVCKYAVCAYSSMLRAFALILNLARICRMYTDLPDIASR